MGVDGITFIAQLINLCILIWLLKKFLYHPILRAVENRQQIIMDKVNQAHDEAKKAEEKAQELQNLKIAFANEKKALLEKAYQEAESIKQENNKELALQKEKGIAKLHQELKNQKQAIALEIENLVVENFMVLSNQLCQEFGALSPMDNVVNLFENQLLKIDSATKAQIKKILSQKPFIMLSSSQELTDAQENSIKTALQSCFELQDTTIIKTKIDTDLLLGMQLGVGDMLIEWHLKAYLDKIYDNIRRQLIEKLK